MDCRITIGTNETFNKLLNEAYQAGEKCAMIIDDNGLERMEGFISVIDTTAPSPFIELDNGQKVFLNKVVAVNGIFLPGYGEC